jgi:outer membrane protein
MFRWTALFLFVAMTCAVATSALAQSDATTTGNYLLGGTMSWNSVDNDNATERFNNWTVAPRVMYFMMDNLALGAEVGFTGNSFGDTGFSAQRYFAIAEYVLPGGNESFRFYGEAGGGFSRQTTDDTTASMAFNGWGLTAGIGAYMFLNDHVAITPAISYIYESFGDDGTITRGTDQTIFLRIGVSGFLLP